MSSEQEPLATLHENVTDLRADDASSFTQWKAWGLRPIMLFAAAYTMVGVLHEWAHALTAYALNVPSTLLHLHVHLDAAEVSDSERAVIRVAGPLFCLVVGIACWFVYRKLAGPRAKLLLLYLAWFGIGTFLGNLVSTPFVGDFSGLALAFHLPMSVRYAAALAGLMSLCGLSYFVGAELRQWSPGSVSPVKAMMGMIVLPSTAGTALALLIFLPMSSDFAVSRMGEAAFWIFGVAGTMCSRKRPAENSRSLHLGWSDFAILFAAVLIVRVMAQGIVLAR